MTDDHAGADGETIAAAYQRGREVGDTARQLAEHAEHLAKINGSQKEAVDELRRLREHEVRPIRLELARLANQRDADQATAEALATALRLAEEARDRALEAEQKQRTGRWQPLVPIGALVALVLSILALAQFVTAR